MGPWAWAAPRRVPLPAERVAPGGEELHPAADRPPVRAPRRATPPGSFARGRASWREPLERAPGAPMARRSASSPERLRPLSDAAPAARCLVKGAASREVAQPRLELTTPLPPRQWVAASAAAARVAAGVRRQMPVAPEFPAAALALTHQRRAFAAALQRGARWLVRWAAGQAVVP